MGSLPEWAIWLIAMILFMIIEAVTFNLVTIWFAAGSLVALILALAGASMTWQLIAFGIVSLICLVLFLVVFKPRMNSSVSRPVPTNADRIIGCEGIVIQSILPLEGQGQIRVNGQIWSAISQDESIIERDRIVIVQEIRGVRAVVAVKQVWAEQGSAAGQTDGQQF